MYKRGFVIFGVVSLTMGNSAFPLGHRLIAHAKLFCQLFLCHSEGLSFPGDVRSNFDQIHSITSLLALSLLFFHAEEHPSEVELVFFSEKDSAKPKTELQQSLLIFPMLICLK